MSTSLSLNDNEFMETVRTYRVLFDKGCTDFKNQVMKSNAWKQVSEKAGMDPQLARKRYDNIRSSFGRYIRTLKPPSGSGRDAIVLDQKFEYLRWLMPYIKHREQASSNINMNLKKHSDSDPADRDGNFTEEDVANITTSSSTVSVKPREIIEIDADNQNESQSQTEIKTQSQCK